MFLLEIAIISIIVGLIRKGSIKNFFVGGLRGWYIFLVSIILFMSQKVLALTGVTALNDYAFWITIAAYILLFIGLFLNLEGIWVYALLIGALMNFVIIVLNGGLMPVSESALNIALGDAAATYTSNFAATMSVATDSTIFLWKYLGAIIPLPLPSIFAEVLTPGTIIMAISSFGFIQSIMTTEYMDEDEYEQYMQELSSEDKKDAPLLDEAKEEKYDEPADNEIDYTSMDSDDIFDNEANDNDVEDTTENVSLDEELEELSNEDEDEETDYFADFDLEDLRDDEEETNEDDLSEIEEEGAKLEDEDLLKELEDEFNAGEEELFAEDDSLDSLIDDALSEDELDNEQEQEEEPEEVEEVTEEIEVDDDENDLDIPLEAAAFAAGAALAASEDTNENKDSDLEDLLTEALGDDEEDEEIQELLNELRSLSEDDTTAENDIKQNEESLDIAEDENEEENNEEIDYDFFKDEDENDNEIEEVTNEDLSQTVEYEEDEEQKDMLSDEDEEVSTEEPIVASRNNIQDAKDFLNKVGKQKQEKTSDPVNPMPDVDVDSPFIITDGRIVENPYYKFKKGTTTRREEAVSSPQIDDNGIYVMSSGELAKVKGGKVQPKIPPKDETKTQVKKTNIPNMTYTPGFDKEEEKPQKEQYTPITTKLEKDEERKSSKIPTNDYSSRIPMDNPYDDKQEKQTIKPKRQYRRYTPTSEQLEREPNMTIINDSSTGRTIKRDSRYPREEILPTYKDSVIDENGKEVPNPYEKVEMKIGDVEIKFWKKDNQ